MSRATPAMISHRIPILSLAVSMLALGSVPARGQAITAADAERRIREIDGELTELDDIARKMRGGNHRVVIAGTRGDPQAVLVSPEQVESLFVTALLNGSMRPDQAAGLARLFGEMTRIYLEEVDGEIRRLREQRERLARALTGGGIEPPARLATPVPGTLQGSVNGKWSAGCSWNDPDIDRSTDGGTFTVTFDGQGGVSGVYESSSSSFGVSGTIAADGTANGNGTGSGWSVTWSGRFEQRGGATVGSGGLGVTITDFGGGSCTGTWAVP